MHRHLVPGIGTFCIPSEPIIRRADSEFTVNSIFGWVDYAKALAEGSSNERCGQEYSYLHRGKPEDVRTFLDIGCNVLATSVWACRVWWPETIEVVHAYDPGEAVMACALENMSLIQRGVKVTLDYAAVTSDPKATYLEDVRTGCSRTHGVVDGVPVSTIHPRDLPPADAIKIDAEGVEGELLDWYPYWLGVKVLMIEWHSVADRVKMHARCADVGLVLAKDDCGESEQGVACWVRS